MSTITNSKWRPKRRYPPSEAVQSTRRVLSAWRGGGPNRRLRVAGGEGRTVPSPPELTALLLEHVGESGTGRLACCS